MRDRISMDAAVRRTAIVAVVVGFAALAGTTRSFTWPAAVVTAMAAVAVAVLAIHGTGRRGASGAEVTIVALIAWAAVALAAVTWQLAAYLQSPRADHPTISSILDAADSHAALRAAVFLGWLLLGIALARR